MNNDNACENALLDITKNPVRLIHVHNARFHITKTKPDKPQTLHTFIQYTAYTQTEETLKLLCELCKDLDVRHYCEREGSPQVMKEK